MVLDILGAESSILLEIRKVVIGGYTKFLILQFVRNDEHRFIVLEDPTISEIEELSEVFKGFKKFELRSDKLMIDGAESIALHILAS